MLAPQRMGADLAFARAIGQDANTSFSLYLMGAQACLAHEIKREGISFPWRTAPGLALHADAWASSRKGNVFSHHLWMLCRLSD